MSDATSHEILEIEVVEDEPLDGVSPALIRSGLESEDPIVKSHAARVAESVASGDVDAILEILPTVIDRLDDDHRVVVTKCAITASIVAEDHPEALESAIPRLVEMLSADLSLVRVFAAQALSYVGLEEPDVLLGHEDRLVDALFVEKAEVIDSETLAEETESPTQFETINQMNVDEDARYLVTKNAAANLLVEVAERDAERLVDDADRIGTALEETPSIALPCLQILNRIARVDASAVEGYTETVLEFLDHPDEAVAASAVTSLGYVGDPAAIDPLHDLAADDDREEDLRELAEETAAFIEDSTR